VLSRLNAKQASLNRRRLKHYIKIFGAPYKGEGLRGKQRELVNICIYTYMHTYIHIYI
jgi:hypothetical protein